MPGLRCSKFPQDVLSNEPMMQLLALCASRMEHMQVMWRVAATIIENENIAIANTNIY